MNKPSSLNKKIEPVSPAPDVEKRDIIDDFMFRAADYVYKKKKLFISLAITATLILTSAYGAFEYMNYRDDFRGRKLYEIERQLYDASLTDEQRFEKVLPMLNGFVEKYPQTKQWSAALFYRSNLYYKQKEYQKAENDLRAALAFWDKDSSIYAIAGVYLSNVLWDQGKAEEAIRTLESLKAESMVEIILMELAEKYLSSNQTQNAKQTMELLLKDFPQTRYRAKINQLLKTI